LFEVELTSSPPISVQVILEAPLYHDWQPTYSQRIKPHLSRSLEAFRHKGSQVASRHHWFDRRSNSRTSTLLQLCDSTYKSQERHKGEAIWKEDGEEATIWIVALTLRETNTENFWTPISKARQFGDPLQIETQNTNISPSSKKQRLKMIKTV
jgi:hypothetical protein